jgi:hypothetical protein
VVVLVVSTVNAIAGPLSCFFVLLPLMIPILPTT